MGFVSLAIGSNNCLCCCHQRNFKLFKQPVSTTEPEFTEEELRCLAGNVELGNLADYTDIETETEMDDGSVIQAASMRLPFKSKVVRTGYIVIKFCKN